VARRSPIRAARAQYPANCWPLRRCLAHAGAAVALSCLVPAMSMAYRCERRTWPIITISPILQAAGQPSSYTLATRVPDLPGCDVTTQTVLVVDFPPGTDATTVTGGTVNGSAIRFESTSAQTLVFKSPVAVAYDKPIVIVLHGIITRGSGEGFSVRLAATGVKNGSIRAGQSDPFDVVTPTPTHTPTRTPTPTMTPRRTKGRRPPLLFPTLTPTPSATPTRPAGVCPADCDGSGDVSVAEVIVVANLAAAATPPVACPAGDRDGDDRIRIDEVLTAVAAALSGCGASR